MAEFVDQDLRGAQFRRVDLSGSRFHSVELENVRITDAWVNNLDISGYLGTLIVNEVDVTAFVWDELDKRYPDRRKLQAADPEGLRAAWAMIGEKAQATLQRAEALPAAALDESVDGEWSYLQTLRHLVFATDRWITDPVLGEPSPFHPLGFPHDGSEEAATLGLDTDARPSLEEVLEARRDRMERVTALLAAVSEDDLGRTVPNPNGGETSVLACIRVVLDEEWAHNRYANRDLDTLTPAAG
jgi:hypothetical protein